MTGVQTCALPISEIISGDGQTIHRQRISLTDTDAFGSRKLNLTADLRNQKWVRVEAWDIAANGAFTQPVWVEP